MPKVALLQPNADELYGHRQGYDDLLKRPPETSLAVLSFYLRQENIGVICLDPNNSDVTLAERGAAFDFVGFTDWFSNHHRVINIAELIKTISPKTRIVVGGPNATGLGGLILEKHPFIDYVVVNDGEEALLKLTNCHPPEQIPNLWYRHKGKIKFTYPAWVNLNRLPCWDFANFENLDERLVRYREAVARSGDEDFDPWLIPPLTIFSFRGCIKAIKEGVCSYCSSAETTGRALSPVNFWAQLRLLEEKYGATHFYMADDIFTVTLHRMEQLAMAKPDDVTTPTIRAYAHMPDFILLNKEQLNRMAEALVRIGVFNLFFGVESFGLEQITRTNKTPVSIKDSERIIKELGAAGIETTTAYLLGLPGETEQSLELNLRSLEIFLKTGFVERIYLSVVMALRGTPMFDEFCHTPAICKDYKLETSKDLINDDNLDYSLLQRLGVEYLTDIEPVTLNKYLREMIWTAEQYLPPHRVGGFLLESI